MDPLNKFYPKVQPLLTAFWRENHRDIPVKAQKAIQELFNQAILKVADIYRKEILRDKFNLDIDLTKYPQYDSTPGQSFIQKFNPCEVCGQLRVVHQCHIIPRNHGGADKADNYVILCANHHHLFDRHKLAEEEWGRIDWSTKSEEVQEYVFKVRLPRQKMFWKYRSENFSGCTCGSTDFQMSFKEDPGQGAFPVEGLYRNMECKKCGQIYTDCSFTGYEYTWWWFFVQEKFKRG